MTPGMEGEFLCKAVDTNNIEILKDLLKYGADIDAMNVDGSTALHTAIVTSNLEFTKFLIECGASLMKADARGSKPIDLAEKQKQEDLISLCCQSQYNSSENIEKVDQDNIQVTRTPSLKKKNLSLGSVQRNPRRVPNYENSIMSILPSYSHARERNSPTKKENPIRVSVYRYHPKGCNSKRQIGILINLPGSLEELFQFARK